jgi:hypothetical protein
MGRRAIALTLALLLVSATPGGFDVGEVARLESDWWQARRKKASPSDYGVTVAALPPSPMANARTTQRCLDQASCAPEAMAYRDARG